MQELLSFLTFLHILSFSPSPYPTTPPIICIDSGHGGNDPGAINQDITEAQETLDIGQRLQSLLKAKKYTVIMTRIDSSATLSNSERADICNSNHADILISIHLNENDDPTYDSIQGLYGTGTENKDKKFTDFIHSVLVNQLNLADEGTTDFGDNVLIKANMPATLQETAYISSRSEYQELTDGTGNRQQQIAQALFNGIVAWFNGQRK